MDDEDGISLLDKERDALHILPLCMLPFKTTALRRARLIKNTNLKSVVELFAAEGSGSGQLDVREVSKQFDWPDGHSNPDMVLLRKLEPLPSFDVYSLRILLRQHGIAVDSQESLKLSEAKTRELSEYMTEFTHPLIKQVYGGGDMDISSFDDILALLRDPDIQKVREKLGQLAEKLGINMMDIPSFLEDYGDIFLSFAYYRQCLTEIEPVIDEFLDSMSEIRNNFQLKQDQNLMNTCKMLERTVNELMVEVSGRFENFDRSTNDLWSDISAERFQMVKKMIESYHVTIGGVLCALTVKVDAWHHMFPSRDSGGPVKRGEFILNTMKQGIGNIQKIENTGPLLASRS
ncbi:MAG: hypothetical protein HQ504_05290 [Rhodospirillaceae bacterium]|nr:hypothetical protein [Rhodospirillaceae bacterium]